MGGAPYLNKASDPKVGSNYKMMSQRAKMYG